MIGGKILAVALAVFAAAEAFAQPVAPTRVRGEIVKLEGTVLTVKSREGPTVVIKLAENFAVAGVVPIKLDEIKPGSYIGTATLGEVGGALVALEVLVFPDSMRGVGEGHYPWDLKPGSMMTNAAVAEAVAGGKGRLLMLKYKDGEKKVMVPEDAPVVTFAPADVSAVKPGAHVLVTATKQSDGSLTAPRVAVGLNGLVPPM